MKRIFAIILIAFLNGGFLHADTSSDEKIRDLEKRIADLEQKLAAATQQKSDAELEEIRRQLTVLATEVEKLRSGEETEEMNLTDQDRRSLGLGSSAASVYNRKQGVSIAGYGEMVYQNFDSETDSGFDSGKTDSLDFLRGVIYFGYRFNDRFLFNSELEVEHATTGEGDEEKGEVSLEFAYIDFRANDSLNLRGGMVLIPMGFINEFHEPTSYLGARRPVTETFIIPSTWRENGFGVVGRHGIFDYRAYLVAGLNAAEFTSDEGLREGRQGGAESKLGELAFTGRADVYATPALLFGGSLFYGNSIVFEETTNNLEVPTFIWEIHGEYKEKGFEIRGLYSRASLDDVAELNAILGIEGSETIGETLDGGYIQAGYNLFSGKKDQGLTPYFRYEKVNTQSDVPAGFLTNPALEQTLWTLGLEYRPIRNLVFKTDYQVIDNEADTGVDQLNFQLGYSF